MCHYKDKNDFLHFQGCRVVWGGQGGSVRLSAQTHMTERTIPSSCPLPSHKLSHMNATSPPNMYNKKTFLIKKIIYSRLTVSTSQVLRFQEAIHGTKTFSSTKLLIRKLNVFPLSTPFNYNHVVSAGIGRRLKDGGGIQGHP